MIKTEVCKLLYNVLRNDEFFDATFEIAPLSPQSQLTFLIKINNEKVFMKTLNQLSTFTKQMNQKAKG